MFKVVENAYSGKQFDFTPLDTFILKSGALTVPGELLELFNKSLLEIEHVFN